MLAFVFFVMMDVGQGQDQSPQVHVEKKIVYQKETTVDLEGAQVKGKNQLPPAFFVTKMNTPKGVSLLAQRLNFKLRHYNDLGF